ncbi:MAG: hypothetical protein AAF799_09855 [Myxococcota bacterium]
MLSLRSDQTLALADAAWAATELELAARIVAVFPVDAALLGPDDLQRTVHYGVTRARARGFETVGEVCRYVDLALVLGSDFDVDPLLPWATEILARPGAAGPKLDDLDAVALAYLTDVAGEHGEHYTRALLRARRLRLDHLEGIDDLEVLLSTLYPAKYREAQLDRSFGRFVEHVDHQVEAFGFHEVPGARPCFAALMFLLGSGFAEDPRWPFAARGLESTGTPSYRLGGLLSRAQRHLERAFSLLRGQEAA